MKELTEHKKEALGWLDNNRGPLNELGETIWAAAETAWREYNSAAALADFLEQAGFEVERGSAGMPTAFCATWGSGEPVLASFANYDCTPGLSQQAVSHRVPREGTHRWAPGHTDPHNALTLGTLGGVLAAKAVMERHGIGGTIRYFGEPAEKLGGGQPVHALRGYYNGLDAVLAYRPWTTNTTVWDTHAASYYGCVFSFLPKPADDWPDSAALDASPAAPGPYIRPPGALDAACMMHTLAKQSKEHIYPHVGGWSINEYMMLGGQATADAVVPKIAQIQYAWRSPTIGTQEQIYHVLAKTAAAAASACHCDVTVRWLAKTRPGVPNHALARLTFENLAMTGGPDFPEEARGFAREILAAEGLDQPADPFSATCRAIVDPEVYEAQVRQSLPPWQKNITAEPYVEYTHYAPTAWLFTGKPVVRENYEWLWNHWSTVAINGFTPAIEQTWLSAARAIAGTMLDLLTEPALLAACRQEFRERTGGGVGGTSWVPPLLPDDFRPPIDLAWPEYVQTVRGTHWQIPEPETFGTPL